MSQYDVLLRGSPFFDLTFTFEDRETLPELGQEVFASDLAVNPGGVFNISSTLARLSLKVGLRARLGNDMFSRFIAERMEDAGLPLDLVEWADEPLPVVTVGISFPHDRVFISYAPPDRRLSPTVTVDDVDRCKPRALFSYGELGHDIYRTCRQRGILTVIDTFWNPEHLRSEMLREVLPEVDVVCPNEPEAKEMTQAATAEEALEALSQLCRCVVIKRGRQGCIAACGQERYCVPALPVAAIETTGAGDNFNAGLIYGLLQGYTFERSLRCANIAGGLSTLAHGGCGSGITSDILEEWLKRLEGAS